MRSCHTQVVSSVATNCYILGVLLHILGVLLQAWRKACRKETRGGGGSFRGSSFEEEHISWGEHNPIHAEPFGWEVGGGVEREASPETYVQHVQMLGAKASVHNVFNCMSHPRPCKYLWVIPCQINTKKNMTPPDFLQIL